MPRMAKSPITSALFAMVIAASPALACKGANVLFRDDFTEDDSAWDSQDASVEIRDGVMESKVEPGFGRTIMYHGQDFPAADACVDMIAPISKNPVVFGGLAFWGNKKWNIVWLAPSAGTAGVTGHVEDKWTDPVPSRKFDGMKATPDAVNTIRVTWKGPPAPNAKTAPDPTVTVYINDKQFIKFKVPPNEDRSIALYAEEGPVFKFKNSYHYRILSECADDPLQDAAGRSGLRAVRLSKRVPSRLGMRRGSLQKRALLRNR